MVISLIRLVMRGIPLLAKQAHKYLPRAVPNIVAGVRKFIGNAGSLVTGVRGKTFFARTKGMNTAGLINAVAIGAGAASPLLGGIGGAVFGGKGQRIKGLLAGAIAGGTVRRISQGGMMTSAGLQEKIQGQGGGGIIKNEITSIPGAAQGQMGPRRARAPTRKRRGVRRRRISRRRGRRGRRRMARPSRRMRNGRWGPRHRRTKRHTGGRSGHGRHGRVTFTTKSGKRVSFTAHKRR